MAIPDPLSATVVDELISTISHELRTPLTAIKGCARTLLRHEASLDPETRRQLLRDIDDEAARLHRLLENLLELSRAGCGVGRLSTRPTAIDVLIRRIIADMAPRAGERRFRLHLPAALPPSQVDPVRIEQVVRNLLDNAIKYSPPDGAIHVGARDGGGMLVVTITNDGPGIAPEHLARIFERFYRVEQPGQGAGGAGLGLAICRRFIELHGGHIEVQSAPGCGASFRFTLPTVAGTDP